MTDEDKCASTLIKKYFFEEIGTRLKIKQSVIGKEYKWKYSSF